MWIDVSKKYEDENLEAICFFAALTDAPAYVFQVVSEVYEVDFWELWERVKDVAKRKEMLYQMEIPQEIISISTMNFFKVVTMPPAAAQMMMKAVSFLLLVHISFQFVVSLFWGR